MQWPARVALAIPCWAEGAVLPEVEAVVAALDERRAWLARRQVAPRLKGGTVLGV